MAYWLSFVIFWGVWLLVPMIVDGLTTLVSLVGVLVAHWRQRGQRGELNYYPFITVILPIYNSADTLEACLRSIAAQDYPLERIEVLLINNGSKDNSFDCFARLQGELPLLMHWHSILNQGKAWAMNAGIHLARGDYIFNIDSDVVLAPDALRQVVARMEAEPEIGAVTGAIDVLPAPPNATPTQRLLAACEFFEYLTAFHVGREQQSLLQNLYTLSGAFSVFRREVIMQTFMYDQITVTEDTDLTFELYERFKEWQVLCVSDAIAYVHPVESLAALYAQRVRWQRGQIEVSARHEALLARPFWHLYGFSPGRVLLIDHTLAFPRLIWTLLLPILTLFGYPLSLIVLATLILYAFYLVIDLAWILVAWLGANKLARQRLRGLAAIFLLLPLYRMLIFWFRFSGFLHAIAEPGSWRVQDPISQIRAGLHDLADRIRPQPKKRALPKQDPQ